MPVKDEITVSSTTDDAAEVNRVAGVEDGDEEQEEKETDGEEKEEGKEDEEESKEEGGEEEEKKEDEEEKSEEGKEKDDSKEKKGVAKKDESEEEEEEDRSKWPKWRRKMQKRIDKLTARLESKGDKEEAEEEESEEEPEKVLAEDRPRRKDYKTQEEYEDAVADWRIDQREAKKAVDEHNNQLTKEFNTYNSHLKQFEEDQDDFEEVRDKVKTAGIEIPEAVQVTIIQEDRPDIAYALAKDLEFCKKLVEINKTSPAKAVVALTKFIVEHDAKAPKPKIVPKKPVKVAKVEEEEEQEEAPKKVVKPPAAKAPVSQVKGGSGTKVFKKKLDDEEVSFQEYKRRREAGES